MMQAAEAIGHATLGNPAGEAVAGHVGYLLNVMQAPFRGDMRDTGIGWRHNKRMGPCVLLVRHHYRRLSCALSSRLRCRGVLTAT